MCHQFNKYSECGTIFVQDTTHIATKLRNRLLKPGITLPMGSFHVSIHHLIYLVENVQKSSHGLARADVIPLDKMNFDSFNKIIDQRVIEMLQTCVKDSEATIKYLSIMP